MNDIRNIRVWEIYKIQAKYNANIISTVCPKSKQIEKLINYLLNQNTKINIEIIC